MYGSYDQLGNLVTARSGAKVRAEASINSKVLGLIPYGDTLQVIKLSKEATLDVGHRYAYGLEVKESMPIEGRWVEIRYQGQTAYVFSALIGSKHMKIPQKNPANELIYEETSCDLSPFKLDPNYHWYGLYQLSEGKYEMRSVQLYLYNSYNDPLSLQSIDTDQKERAAFIWGTEQAGKTGIIEGKWEDEGTELRFEKPETLEIGGVQFSLETGAAEQDFPEMGLACVKVFHQGKWVRLPQNEGENEMDYLVYASIQWVGDLDGDGIKDFIISYSPEDIVNHDILYLSTLKTEKCPWGIAYIYQGTMCCG